MDLISMDQEVGDYGKNNGPPGWIVQRRPRKNPGYLGRIDWYYLEPGSKKRWRSRKSAWNRYYESNQRRRSKDEFQDRELIAMHKVVHNVFFGPNPPDPATWFANGGKLANSSTAQDVGDGQAFQDATEEETEAEPHGVDSVSSVVKEITESEKNEVEEFLKEARMNLINMDKK